MFQIRHVLLTIALGLLTTGVLWANNDDFALNGTTYTAGGTLVGDDLAMVGWIGTTDGQRLTGGEFTVESGQVAGSTQLVSAVKVKTLHQQDTPFVPIFYSLFLILFTGVVTLGLLHHSKSNR